jgi:hypothetical protein
VTGRPNDPAWSAAPPDGAADPERLAALLDGRLGEADREALLVRLAHEDDDLALFAEAAAIQRELEAEDGRVHDEDVEDADHPRAPEPGVIPLRRPARPARVLDRRWVAAAAMVAGVALVPLAWRASQGGAVREPSHAVAMLENPSAGLPAGWDDDRPWSRTRSRGEVTTEAGLAVRTGAYMVDIEIAARAGDAERTRSLAQRVALNLTEASTAGTMAAARLNEVADRAGAPAAELLPLVKAAGDAAADAVDPDRYALGAWAEAALLAAARRDAGFFREGRTRRTLESAEALVGDNEEARTALSAIRAALEAESVLWPELDGGLDELMRAVA